MCKRKKLGIVLAGLLLAGGLAAGVCHYVKSTYTVQTVYVEGNVHYTEEEIRAIVMNGILGDNSLYLSLKYRNREIQGVPFVDTMEVRVLAPDTIKIIVYEKVLTGYVRFMDTYMYFDRDGYVVESSGVRTAGVPQVTGLEFDHVVVGEMLPVEDQEIFDRILNVTKLLNKYELSADRLYFNGAGEVVVYFGGVKVALGSDTAVMEDRLMLLPELLPSLEGKTGVLQMNTQSEGAGRYTFRPE